MLVILTGNAVNSRYRKIIIAIGPVRMFDNFRRFGRICSVISVGSVRFGSVTGFIHSHKLPVWKNPKQCDILWIFTMFIMLEAW